MSQERKKMKMGKCPRWSGGRILLGFLFVIALFVATPHVRACTAFLQDGVLLAGKNLDWNLDEGLLIVNKKGVPKRAMVLDPSEKTAQWVSKYGSVTFNQYGREMPSGGMNEVGLVIESLWLDNTRNPAPDERPGLISWAQYQLDNCRTVAEVAATDTKIRISPTMPMPLHFFVCDREGNAAVVEFLDGKLVCHTGDKLPYKLITNNTCEESLAYLNQHTGFGGSKPVQRDSRDSLDRYVIAAERLKAFRAADSKQTPVRYAFDTLAAVRQGNATKWTIIYDLKNLEFHYKTDRCTEVRTVQLAGLDFNAKTPIQMISINTVHTGVLNPHFVPYDSDVNRWLVYYCARHTPQTQALPDLLIEAFARYPDTMQSQ
jgi:penicillin V acylase-like amidase (Ntn superfamily)